MKIRNGFVSNSSSSSFVIQSDKSCYGGDSSSCLFGIGFLIDVEDSDLVSNSAVFHYGYSEYGGEQSLTRLFSDMRDDQTLAEFKKETEELFKAAFPFIATYTGPTFIMSGEDSY